TGSTSAANESNTARITTCKKTARRNSSSATPTVRLTSVRKTLSSTSISTNYGIGRTLEMTGLERLLKRRNALLLLVEFDDSSSESATAEMLTTQLYE